MFLHIAYLATVKEKGAAVNTNYSLRRLSDRQKKISHSTKNLVAKTWQTHGKFGDFSPVR